jgi:hypothetical protein
VTKKKLPGSELMGGCQSHIVEQLSAEFSAPEHVVIFCERVIKGRDETGRPNRLSNPVFRKAFNSGAVDTLLGQLMDTYSDELRNLEDNFVRARDLPPSTQLKAFSIYIQDLTLGVSAEPIVFPGGIGDTVESFRSKLLSYVRNSIKPEPLYKAMIAEVDRRIGQGELTSWNDLLSHRRELGAKQRWRDICETTNPWFLTTIYTDDQRRAFEGRSYETISKGLRTGRYESKYYKPRTAVVASRKKSDKPARVRHAHKKSKKSR